MRDPCPWLQAFAWRQPSCSLHGTCRSDIAWNLRQRFCFFHVLDWPIARPVWMTPRSSARASFCVVCASRKLSVRARPAILTAKRCSVPAQVMRASAFSAARGRRRSRLTVVSSRDDKGVFVPVQGKTTGLHAGVPRGTRHSAAREINNTSGPSANQRVKTSGRWYQSPPGPVTALPGAKTAHTRSLHAVAEWRRPASGLVQ